MGKTNLWASLGVLSLVFGLGCTGAEVNERRGDLSRQVESEERRPALAAVALPGAEGEAAGDHDLPSLELVTATPRCENDADCLSGDCDAQGRCVASGADGKCESDLDCMSGNCLFGGRCARSGAEGMCQSNADCLSGNCTHKGQCGSSTPGGDCVVDEDCLSEICAPLTGICEEKCEGTWLTDPLDSDQAVGVSESLFGINDQYIPPGVERTYCVPVGPPYLVPDGRLTALRFSAYNEQVPSCGVARVDVYPPLGVVPSLAPTVSSDLDNFDEQVVYADNPTVWNDERRAEPGVWKMVVGARTGDSSSCHTWTVNWQLAFSAPAD